MKEENELRKFRDRFIQVERFIDGATDKTATTTSADASSEIGMDNAATSVLSAAVVGATPLVKQRTSLKIDETITRVKRHDAELMAELVKLDTAKLRTNLPENEQQELVKRDERRRRRKAMSEGVGTMARMKTLSEGVSAMARMKSNPTLEFLDATVSSRPAKDDTDLYIRHKTYYSVAAQDLKAEDTTREQLRARYRQQQSSRRGRQKSVSDGVALMANYRTAF
jgi:hypothetical protein